MALYGYSEPTNEPTPQPTAGEIAKAVEQLKSDKVEELLAAAKVICRSDDDAAWQALRNALVDPETLKRVEARVVDMGQEGGPVEMRMPDFAEMMRTVGGGTPNKAEATLVWLVEQKPYAETYRTDDKESNKPWRAYLAYDALQYIQKPSKELMEFCRQKLESETFHDGLKTRIMEALASYGTPESLDLFKSHLWTDGGPILLIRHRNNYECVRLLFDMYRGATVAENAHAMLDTLFAETYSPGKFRPDITLPKINPQGEEAKKFVDLLNGFLADHGKIALTEDETAKIKGLIASIETANKPKANLRSIIGKLFHVIS